MKELLYNLYLFYFCGAFDIMGMQTNDRLILADNDFTSVEDNTIKLIKIMIKDRK